MAALSALPLFLAMAGATGPDDGGAKGSASASGSFSTEGDADARADSSGEGKWIRRWAPENHMIEFGPWIGVLFPSKNHEFYDPRDSAHEPYNTAAVDLGFRFGYFPWRFVGGELEVGFMPTQTESDSRALLYTVRGHVMGRLPWWRIAPFLVIGGGGMGVSSGGGAQSDDIDASFHWGPGVELFINRWLATRLDFRHLVGAREGVNNGASSHFEILLGLSITLRLESKKGEKSEGDRDGDGFYGHDDKCPDEPGTYPDGCPAPDRDGDSVADDDDACPDEPGPAPEGCPAPDRDGDGVADTADKCPDEPGAKPDGCPPDSDGDGIADNVDKCPDLPGEPPDGCPPDRDDDGIYDPVDDCPKQPETQNSFEDEDGCPDKVPTKLRGVTGVLPGITFETNSARIRKSSRPTLDEAAQVLKDNPRYDLQVVGHTDNTGGRDYNIRLSKQRADSVKSYLVRRGVESERIRTRGKGPDDPIADNDTKEGRAENRRIDFKLRKRVRRRKREK